ncbi:TraB [Desulforapulum autotrophicum HRM2]|uniref:TraB n=1 Tax=Desulforapulum autotrophicum (strain ATCC 43914 / DSM 3382 / VKM B-1955 / HRM2) TaxID=177437 RepID=C0QM41_DESAH|nr:TraB/GumN family protein [Desulforapulum autotrophicum]ACN14347.1 TraB [Desulforapulum autotrophicum HRM2]
MDNIATADLEGVDRIFCNGKEIILIGTAHVSKESALLVTRVIESERPDTVCVELCETRLQSIRDKDAWRNMDIIKVIREKKAMFLLMNLMLASFQKRIAEKFEIKPGQEMINAIEAGEKIDARIFPADRAIQTTLTRVWRSMGLWERLKLMFQMVFSLGNTDEITEEEIERMKQEDILQTLLADMKRSHPILERILIDERDQFLAETIRTAPGDRIVAVAGAGHVPGIKRYLADSTAVDMDELTRIPRGGNFGKIMKWLIPLAILVLFGAGFFIKGKGGGTDMIWMWIAANGLFAGLGAVAALAHPWTILTSILAAPLTSLNPMIAAGWVSGLVEAISRKPKVKDLESIPVDILTVRGFWRNNVTRILLVVVFTNLGSSIGTMAAIPLMLKVIG